MTAETNPPPEKNQAPADSAPADSAPADSAPADSALPSTSANAAAHRVVVFAAPDDPYALRDVLMKSLGLNAIDAQVHAHAVPGVLPDHLTQQQADALAQAILELGINAAAMPHDEIPDLRESEMVHHARCRETGLEIVEIHGDSECIVPWSDLKLISLGYVPGEQSHRYPADSATVFSTAPNSHCLPLDVPALSGPEVWMIRDNPFHAYLIDHSEMNYEYLGDRKTESATSNFRLFMDDVLQHAPRTYLTPATRAFRQQGLLRHYGFHSVDELRRYTVFHLLVMRRMQAKTRA